MRMTFTERLDFTCRLPTGQDIGHRLKDVFILANMNVIGRRFRHRRRNNVDETSQTSKSEVLGMYIRYRDV